MDINPTDLSDGQRLLQMCQIFDTALTDSVVASKGGWPGRSLRRPGGGRVTGCRACVERSCRNLLVVLRGVEDSAPATPPR
jgi:hypothetical protein